MTDAFTRRHLLGLAAGGAAATATTAVAGRDLREERERHAPADRLALWTPADQSFLPRDGGPTALTAARLPALAAVEERIDGRLRAIPHRWLDRLERLVGLERTAVGGHLRLGGRAVVQVVDWRHDPAAVAARLREADYERVRAVGEFTVYHLPPTERERRRTVPRLDDAVAFDGRRLVTAGAPRVRDAVAPLVAALRARAGESRLVDGDGLAARLLRDEPTDADLLTVVPGVRPWVGDGRRGTAGLAGYRRAVSFGAAEARVRSTLLYDSGAVPDRAALRALFGDGEVDPRVGVEPARRLLVERAAATATVTARASPTAFAQ